MPVAGNMENLAGILAQGASSQEFKKPFFSFCEFKNQNKSRLKFQFLIIIKMRELGKILRKHKNLEKNIKFVVLPRSFFSKFP